MKKIIIALSAITRLSVITCLVGGTLPSVAQETLPQEITNVIRQAFDTNDELHYLDGTVDLNGDGKPEVLVYPVGPSICGTSGCQLFVFTPSGSGYKPVTKISITKPPVRATSATSSGWRNLIVHVSGGGVMSKDVELVFDGRSYPRNPTAYGPLVKRANLEGSELIIEDYEWYADTKLLPAARTSPDTAQAGSGPSFDCVKAKTPVEKLLCADAELAALDRELATVYTTRLSSLSKWSDGKKNEVRKAQKTWLRERDKCTRTSDLKGCVKSAYQRRITELQGH